MVRTQGKELFFHTGGAEMSSPQMRGYIQDDIDLNRTLDHDRSHQRDLADSDRKTSGLGYQSLEGPHRIARAPPVVEMHICSRSAQCLVARRSCRAGYGRPSQYPEVGLSCPRPPAVRPFAARRSPNFFRSSIAGREAIDAFLTRK
jgi:hypothetical protein